MSKATHKRGARQHPRPESPLPAPAAAPRPMLPRGFVHVTWLLFISACAFGVLEVHSSNDTYIGLAAGRLIAQEFQFPDMSTFPVADRFSYTSEGKTWFNQNWLSHVYLWLCWDWFGRNAVIYGTWLIAALVFVFSLGAVWFRTKSFFAAMLVGSAVGIASRDWLSARPATMQFFLLSLLWMCLMALMSQGERRRWWPLGVLFAVFLVWPHAHGSFIFGFGLAGLFIGMAALPRLFKRPGLLSDRQLLTLIGVVVVTAGLGTLLSPYGVENYTHPFKVTESEAFRQVGEWQPPTASGRQWPPVDRFWAMLAIATITPVIALLLWLISKAEEPRGAAPPPTVAPPPWRDILVIVFDVGSVLLGLYMAMWARRFAPVFYILAAPAVTYWILLLGRGMLPVIRLRIRELLILGVIPGAVILNYFTITKAHEELVARAEPFEYMHPDLLSRVTMLYRNPVEAYEFMAANDLEPDVFTEWTFAGPAFFFVPGLQVFIDGRSQQVYSERQYLDFVRFNSQPRYTDETVTAFLGEETDAILRSHLRPDRMSAYALESEQWIPVYAIEVPSDRTEPNAPRRLIPCLFLRADSAPLIRLFDRVVAGTARWPDTAGGRISRQSLRAALQAAGRLPPATTQPTATQPGAGEATPDVRLLDD